MYSPADSSFKETEVLATGTEDYYNSGYYFVRCHAISHTDVAGHVHVHLGDSQY